MVSDMLELVCGMLIMRGHHLRVMLLWRSSHVIVVIVVQIFLAIEVCWTFVLIRTTILKKRSALCFLDGKASVSQIDNAIKSR